MDNVAQTGLAPGVSMPQLVQEHPQALFPDPRARWVPGVALDLLEDTAWVEANFGKNYAAMSFSDESLSALIDTHFFEPSVDLGIDFQQFWFGEDWELSAENGEIVAGLEFIAERVESYQEYEATDLFWNSVDLDPGLLARYLPLLKMSEDRLLFHAQHLYQLLEYLHDSRRFGALLQKPSGPLADRF